ncbi:hypothetical protein EJ066_22115 [Mesorhizobium sp. M9A.F.Ca.ET.002.03.1.2]|uniref:hypothetical protein n=1 Tax=Mesorhizobium sp. M9A.F.Ca.ET.002.03.1.2 TaxID=2493668 RepID=UPI000F758A6D|nr:hypothetical protein [Mesorhizobium sp. M9A.F.Ca.ET.002.03.1.2]AZN99597.1 hypothetical protein EJ066_22115 [Mesorhizobium sp. M9A.F.Ca.ET.002.03.1.2]
MFEGLPRLFPIWLGTALFVVPVSSAVAQDVDGLGDLKLPGISRYAPPNSETSLALGGSGAITLSAQLTDKGADITRGIVWRIFKPEPTSDGKLPMVASAHGGSAVFQLEPGSYLVHASYGRAGATKRITVGKDAKRESLVLDAGGLKLDAVLSGGVRIPPKKLRFSIYEGRAEANHDRALIIPDVEPNSVVRLNAGVYHVVSTYGSVNAVIRSDIRVEAGKLTEAAVEHHAAEMTMKLVRESGGEAIADTSWSLLNESGDPIKETVGAFASMVLAEGDYTIIAKNRDRIYQKDFTVVAGQNKEIEVLATEASAINPEDGAD